MRWPIRFFNVQDCATWLKSQLINASVCSLVFFTVPRLQLTNGIWPSYGGNNQHQAISRNRAPELDKIAWSRKVDLNPQYSGNDLLIHYGSPLVTRLGNVVVPVKTGTTGGFRVDGYRGQDGLRLWSMATDYILPAHTWTPSMGPSIVGVSQLAVPGAGGTVYIRSSADAQFGSMQQLCFYGINTYRRSQSWANLNIHICTPITSDVYGNMWFGYRVDNPAPLNFPQIKSGIAHLKLNGTGNWINASDAAGGDPSYILPAMNCAPALSPDSSVVYMAVKKNGFGGALVGLDAQSLAPLYQAGLFDPVTGLDARVADQSTSSPTVGPDGNVFYGVLENPNLSNDDRGWLLHFDSFLNQVGAPGAFGWDDTCSIVPAAAVRSYFGPSTYLVLTKYNNYAGIGPNGDGHNRVAILDPNVSSVETYSGFSCMNEVQTVLGLTPDSNFPNLSGAVREWCINSAAVDPFTRCAIVNSEDGKVYRWDFDSGTLSQQLTLTGGVGEAYTPTVIGANGMAFAINNATLFAIVAQVKVKSLSTESVNVVGGDTATITLTLNGLAPASFYVNVTSDNSDAIAPGLVLVPQGSLSTTFDVPTNAVGGQEVANLTATDSNGNNATIQLTLNPPPP